MKKTGKNIWQKVLLVLCLALMTILPAAQAAEPAQAGNEDAWTLVKRACELANRKTPFGMDFALSSVVQGPAASGIVLSASGVTASTTGALSGNHTEGQAVVEMQLFGMKTEFSFPVNTYNVVKGKKVSVYTLQSDGSWQVENYKAATGMADKIKSATEKSPLLLARCFEAVIAGEKDGVLDIKLLPREDFALSELSRLTEEKELQEMQKDVSRYLVPFRADNMELHLFINRATGEMISLQSDLSAWLKEELLLLNGMREFRTLTGLPSFDLSDAECSMTVNCKVTELPADYKITVPDEVRKSARKAGKK